MKNKIIRTIIIDDEELARQIIRRFLQGHSEIEVIAECENGFEGFKAINELQPDLIFLDIKMPKITGFEMLELVENPPAVIFSTAYDEFAIKAFELNAADYLLKPYSEDRFNEALARAKERLAKEESPKETINELSEQIESDILRRVVVRLGNRIQIVNVDDVVFLEAQDDYVEFHTKEGKYLKQNTMKYFESRLNPEDFIRIHRSYIVAVKEIQKIEPYGKDTHVAILQNGQQLGVSRSGYQRLKQILNF